MIDSAARAERFDPAPSISPCYTWEVPQKPVLVRLPLLLIDRLEREAVETFRSVSSRGSEIGGILWGTVESGEPAAVSVVEYDLVPSDYGLGPLYRLSETDTARLDKALAQRGGSGLRPVGFFRSHTRKGLSLDGDDLALMESRFKDAHQVALVIRPYATKASTAGIFIRENGVIQAESSYLEFPFRSAQLAPSKHLADAVEPAPNVPAPPVTPKPAVRAQIVPIASRRDIVTVPALVVEAPPPPPAQAVPQPVPQPVAQAVPPPVQQSSPQTTPPPEKPLPEPVAEPPAKPAPLPVVAKPSTETRKSVLALDTPVSAGETEAKPETSTVDEAPAPAKGFSKLIWFGVGMIFPILLSGILFVYPGVLRRTSLPGAITGQDSSPLALRVERSGSELLLTWNNDSSAIRNATRAVLSISDGEQHENVEMDLAQLRNGRIEYLPVTGDVVFKMEVSGKDNTKTASESVRVLRTRPSPMPQDPETPTGTAKSPTPNGAPNAATTAPGSNPQTTNGQPTNPGGNDLTPDNAAATAPAPTPAPLKAFNTASLSDRLRPVRSDEIALPDAPLVGGANVAASDSALRLTAVTSPALPAAIRKNDPPPPQTPKTASNLPAGGDVQQAQLIYRKNPDYPALARSAGAKGTVELIATIGTNGRVKAVKITKGHPLLQKAAVDAVMQWQYRPTMLNGHPVETETTVTLNFVAER
jgi:TonB family protein